MVMELHLECVCVCVYVCVCHVCALMEWNVYTSRKDVESGFETSPFKFMCVFDIRLHGQGKQEH